MTRISWVGRLFLCLLLAISVPRSTAFTLHSQQHQQRIPLLQLSSSDNDSNTNNKPILCDLQTFLRLLNLDEIPTGGAAKVMIQGGEVLLNGQVETRRAKKLFAGDKVRLVGLDFDDVFDVSAQVAMRGYVYKPKKNSKKQK